ncbi:uncharacterized protein LOC134279315 [Saccostrea cucullata]|uniref:uncharacterized protein LOC134279315 n=1 Tax=Saccostrea cuccullata TaxID=36930 RepID=UPI002ED5BA36
MILEQQNAAMLFIFALLLGYFVDFGNAGKAVCTRPAAPTTLNFPEDLTVGTILYSYSGTDSDGDTVYYFTYGGAKAPFSLQGRDLSLISALDFENPTSLYIVDTVGYTYKIPILRKFF